MLPRRSADDDVIEPAARREYLPSPATGDSPRCQRFLDSGCWKDRSASTKEKPSAAFGPAKDQFESLVSGSEVAQ